MEVSATHAAAKTIIDFIQKKTINFLIADIDIGTRAQRRSGGINKARYSELSYKKICQLIIDNRVIDRVNTRWIWGEFYRKSDLSRIYCAFKVFAFILSNCFVKMYSN